MLDIRPKNSLDIGCFVGAVGIETSLSAVKVAKTRMDVEDSGLLAINLLKQDFSADKPDQKWVSNISYILTEKGCLYLAVGLELNFLLVIA